MPIKGTYYNATLGAAPTTSAQLGGTIQPTVTYTGNASVSSANGVYNQGSFTFNTSGTWIVTFYMAALVTTPPDAVLSIFGGASPYTAVSCPFVTTNSGSAPNIACYASGSFVCTTTVSITFQLFINVFSGAMFTNSGASNVIFTRIA